MAFRPPDSGSRSTPGGAGGGLFASSLSPVPPTGEFTTLEENHDEWEEFCAQHREGVDEGVSDVQIATELLRGERTGDPAFQVSAYRLLQTKLPFHKRDALIRTPYGIARVKPHAPCEADGYEDEAIICLAEVLRTGVSVRASC